MLKIRATFGQHRHKKWFLRMLFEYSEFSPNAHRMILAHSEYIGSRMQLECSSNSVGIFRMLSKCSECKSNAIRLQFECCPNNAHRKVPRMLYECRQNVRRMAAEYGSSVQECKQNAAGIPRMYLECTLNVTRMSRILPDYFLIGYKMLPNLAFSSVSTLNTTAIWRPWTLLLCSR